MAAAESVSEGGEKLRVQLTTRPSLINYVQSEKVPGEILNQASHSRRRSRGHFSTASAPILLVPSFFRRVLD